MSLFDVDPFPAPRPDVLLDHQAEELALVDRSIGQCAGLVVRDLSVASHRAVLTAIETLEKAQRPTVVGRLAAALVASKAVGKHWRTVSQFVEWWRWIAGHPRDVAPVDLVRYLRELSHMREARHWFARSAVAVERGELLEAQALAERGQRSIARLQALETRKIARVA